MTSSHHLPKTAAILTASHPCTSVPFLSDAPQSEPSPSSSTSARAFPCADDGNTNSAVSSDAFLCVSESDTALPILRSWDRQTSYHPLPPPHVCHGWVRGSSRSVGSSPSHPNRRHCRRCCDCRHCYHCHCCYCYPGWDPSENRQYPAVSSLARANADPRQDHLGWHPETTPAIAGTRPPKTSLAASVRSTVSKAACSPHGAPAASTLLLSHCATSDPSPSPIS
mmetsp:Transcript_25547/g.36378  ORF Transcript_25547/g.36378 Transcript_25547/m.36378 type:complete len:224 (-) Transcript_25547:90-761(-)